MRVYATGPLMVYGEGGLLHERSLPGAQGRLLLAMLAVEHRRPLSRDELADELWPHGLPRSWETALRALVSKLRAALGRAGTCPDGLIANAFGCYQLQLPRNGWVDVDAAREALHAARSGLVRGDAAAAVTHARVTTLICRRPFLAGHYGAWALAKRDHLHQLDCEAEECLADAFAELGRHRLSARSAAAALAIDPYRERLHQRLIRSHVQAGDHAAAARARARCWELFECELGVQPTAATIGLLHDAAFAE
jgi:DNA-binding SARP family transcriptional activator